MTYKEAIQYVNENYVGVSSDQLPDNGCAVVRLRHKAVLLPEYGVDGSSRDDSDWAFISMYEKIDTGLYGGVYYFNDSVKVSVWMTQKEADRMKEDIPF